MNNQQNNPATNKGAKQANDPSKIDPTKQDERDNDATRIRPSKNPDEKPSMPPEPGGAGSGNKGIEEPSTQAPYKRTPTHKPAPVEEPGKQEGSGINKGNNPAAPGNRQNSTEEKDDSGNPVLKKFGRGL